jgi:DNA processing protein
MSQSNLPYWLAALYLPDIGPRTFLPWLQQFSDIKSLFHASDDELAAKQIPEQHRKKLRQINWMQIEKDLGWAGNSRAENMVAKNTAAKNSITENSIPHQSQQQQNPHHILSLEDPDYPPLLKEIPDPPLVLFVKGDKKILSQRQLAIVGSRSATAAGLKNAEQFAYLLAQAGLAITSGLALGIDGAAHRGALAAKGKTIAVCGTGLNHLYPKSHRSLSEKMIEDGGALVSEFPLTMLPRPENFPRRNRIIVGLSLGVLVIEAALKSGSLITARHALEQGREVFALPGSIHNPLAQGCHHLIRQGAKLVERMDDIFEELSGLGSFHLRPHPPATGVVHRPRIAGSLSSKSLTSAQISSSSLFPTKPWSPGLPVGSATTNGCDLPRSHHQILLQIEYEITPLDVILSRSGLTAGEVSSILLLLELNGYIQSVPGGYIREILNR